MRLCNSLTIRTERCENAGELVETLNADLGRPERHARAIALVEHPIRQLAAKVTRCNIPFVKFGGLKFLDVAHVKDVLTFVRFVENPRDRVAGFRVMQLLPGVGPAAAQRVLDYMIETADPIEVLGLAPVPPRAGDY
jgi:DNA helicase II / ATP-dependent DNA helicase PcrA